MITVVTCIILLAICILLLVNLNSSTLFLFILAYALSKAVPVFGAPLVSVTLLPEILLSN